MAPPTQGNWHSDNYINIFRLVNDYFLQSEKKTKYIRFIVN